MTVVANSILYITTENNIYIMKISNAIASIQSRGGGNNNLKRRVIYNASVKQLNSRSNRDADFIVHFNEDLDLKGRAQWIASTLKNLDPTLTNIHVAAMLGYIYTESKCWSALANNCVEPFQFATSGSGSLGLGQWLWNSRYVKLLQNAYEIRKNDDELYMILDPTIQLFHMLDELQSNRSVFEQFKKMTTVADAARYFKEKFGGTTDKQYHHKKYVDNAKMIQKLLNL